MSVLRTNFRPLNFKICRDGRLKQNYGAAMVLFRSPSNATMSQFQSQLPIGIDGLMVMGQRPEEARRRYSRNLGPTLLLSPVD